MQHFRHFCVVMVPLEQLLDQNVMRCMSHSAAARK